MPNRIRALAAVTAAMCWSGLALQFALIVRATIALAQSGELKFPLMAAVAVFFSFLTLQVTLVAAVTTGFAAIAGKGVIANRLSSALATYMVAGSTIFSVALQPYWHHAGAQFAADVLLHGVTPVLYLAFWFAVPKPVLEWHAALRWLIYPLIYLGVLLLAARWTGFYPYPFIDARILDFWTLVFNVVATSITFVSIGLAIVLASHVVSGTR